MHIHPYPSVSPQRDGCEAGTRALMEKPQSISLAGKTEK